MWTQNERQAQMLARNVATDYVAVAVDLTLGVLMLPFNVAYLGPSAYGLFVLTTSLTTYFSMLDLGYASAQVKFAAQYRALRDEKALNEIASTLFFLFTGMAVLAYFLAFMASTRIDSLLRISPAEAETARHVLLIACFYAALGLPFSVFGGITNGFQRAYVNNVISIATSIAVALVTVLVLTRGGGVLELVAGTTALRVLSLFGYRFTAYRAFPLLSIRWKHVRKTRLREVTGFSVFLLIIEVAGRINFTSDTVVIGAYMGTTAVAVWAVAARLVTAIRSLSTVLSRFLLPIVVDSATRGEQQRLGAIVVQGTRLSLAAVIPLASILGLLADAVVRRWVGSGFEASVAVIQLLAVVVCIRIGTATSYSLLKGADGHRFAAACSMVTALTNLALSIVLVQWYGLVGVAIGTLIPVAIVSCGAVVPAACRRAEVTLSHLLRQAVWPALWPAVPSCGAVMAVQYVMSDGLPMILAASAAGGAVYGLCFVAVALRAEDRQWYRRKIFDLLRRPKSVPVS